MNNNVVISMLPDAKAPPPLHKSVIQHVTLSAYATHIGTHALFAKPKLGSVSIFCMHID